MKLATVQYAPLFMKPAANSATALDCITEAALNGADLVVLPELCLSGYSMLNRAQAKLMADAGVPFLAKVQQACNQFGIAVAYGTVLSEGDKLFNVQNFVTPAEVTTVRKLNRWGNDLIWADAGTYPPPVVFWKGKKVGLLVCADIKDKGPQKSEIDEFYEPGDADIVAFSSNWGVGGFPSVRWVEFATKNKVTLVVSNRYGKEEHNDFGNGGVCIISPKGEVNIEGLRFGAPCIVYGEA